VLRAGIYARISSDREDERLGVDRQVEDCEQLCTDRGWKIEQTYVDNSFSASSGVTRPEYQKLVGDIAGGRIDAVAVYNLDRLTRRPIELEEFTEICLKAGVTQLASVEGTVDMGTGDGLLVARIKGAVAAEEARKTSQRIRRKQLELAEDGKPSGGGTRPFGFEHDRITVNETEAEHVREAADHVLAGGSLRSIKMDWTERGIPTVTGKPWSVTAIRSNLTRPRTAGLRQYQGAWSWDRKAVWPAILDRETWEQVRAVLKDPSRRQSPPNRNYPLRGVLRCSECARDLVAMPRANRRNYGCRKDSGGCGHVFVSADLTEHFVFSFVVPFADSPELRDTIRDEEKGQELEARELVLANARDETALVNLERDHYQDRVISRSTFLRQSTALEKKIDERRNHLATLRGKSVLDHVGGQVQEHWDEMSAEDRRLIILSIIAYIEVTPAMRRGSNVFDPRRLRFVLQYEPATKFDGWISIPSGARHVGTPDWNRLGYPNTPAPLFLPLSDEDLAEARAKVHEAIEASKSAE
jgi:site-specific DNA recombinase